MTERAINRRISGFLDTLTTPNVSYDDLIRDKLKPGKFLYTKTAWIKSISMLLSLAGVVLFVSQSWESCIDKPNWYLIIFPTCLGACVVVQLFFYVFFSSGWTIAMPGKWVKADIISILALSVIGIIASVVTLSERINCRENSTMHQIPAYFGIVGGCLGVIGCVAIFLMYRYKKEPPAPLPIQRHVDMRKSMHA